MIRYIMENFNFCLVLLMSFLCCSRIHLSTTRNISYNWNRESESRIGIDIEHFIGIGIGIGIEVNFGIVPSLILTMDKIGYDVTR